MSSAKGDRLCYSCEIEFGNKLYVYVSFIYDYDDCTDYVD